MQNYSKTCKFKIGDIVKLTNTVGVVIGIKSIAPKWLDEHPDNKSRYIIKVLGDEQEIRDGSRYYSVPDSGNIKIITEKERLAYNLKSDSNKFSL